MSKKKAEAADTDELDLTDADRARACIAALQARSASDDVTAALALLQAQIDDLKGRLAALETPAAA